MIRKVEGGFIVVSHTGKKLSRVYKNRKDAEKRLNEIEIFKHMGQRIRKK